MIKKPFSLLGIVEHGGSGFWYQVPIKAQVKNFGLGFFAQKFDGVGPRLDVLINKTFSLWIAPLYDPEAEKFSGLFALRTQF